MLPNPKPPRPPRRLLSLCSLALLSLPAAAAQTPAQAPEATPTAPQAPAPAQAPGAAPLELGALQEERLPELLWRSSPELTQARLELTQARAELARAGLLPNPGLDLGWGTIPVGTTNPSNLANPLANVPNYTVGLSELVELGKRGPRQEAARAALRARALGALELLRGRYFALLDGVGAVAAAEVKLAALQGLTADAERLTRLQRERRARGDTAGLDVDRAVLEEETLRANLAQAQAELADALRACGQVAGVACTPFGDAERARAFLASHVEALPQPAAAEDLSARPDVQALRAEEQSARARELLARRQAIPDPTVRAGYVRDQFVISGNQRNSLFVGLSLPLPVFDRGQPEAEAAAAQARTLEQARTRLQQYATRELDALRRQREDVQARRTRLQEQTLPLARQVVERLEQAVRAGGAPLQDLLLARRTLGQLLVDAAAVDQRALELTSAVRLARGESPPPPEELAPLL